jgi:hypothetical protein
LISHPEIVILDEPTASLDQTVRGRILTLLAELQARVGAAPGEPQSQPTNHSPEARFDDSVVPEVTSLLTELAIRQLNSATNGTTR